MIQSLKEEVLKEFDERFREEYRKVYSGFLPDEIIDKGNPWFESLLSSAIDKAYAAGREDAVEFIHTHSIRDNHPFEHMIIVNEGVVNEAARTNNLTDTI